MTQNKNTQSDGLCRKIHNAISRIRRTSHQQTEPVRVLHQPGLSKTIPVESEQPSTQREAEIVNSQDFAKSSKKEKLSRDDSMHENKFSDYISNVRRRMMKTSSSVGGGETSTIGDSFNDKITNYINSTKIKVRKTTSIGDDGRRFSIK